MDSIREMRERIKYHTVKISALTVNEQFILGLAQGRVYIKSELLSFILNVLVLLFPSL